MSTVRLGSWVVEAEPEATRAIYARIDRGGSDICTCAPCANFAAARPGCYPPLMLEALEALGIDPSKEVEAAHYTRTATGLHSYGVWFHFVGHLAEGSDRGDYEPVAPNCAWLVRARRDLEDAAFRTLPVLQLDLVIEIPWALSSPESE